MNFKKIMAAVAAMSLVACAAAIPASASAEGATVEIDQVTLTLDELKAANYEVTIEVTLTENAGINAFAFGINVDDRCQFIADCEEREVTMAVEAAKSSDANFVWVNGANASTYKKSDKIITILTVTVPTDAKPGDVFELNYADKDQEGKKHIWSDTTTKVDYVAAGSADAVDGWIKIDGPVETTTTESETTTTESETTTTESETTTTESETTTTSTESETTTTTSTHTHDGGTTTTTTAGPGSPATGTTDVLPIVGVAAAAAILGGVAIVAKKKED